MGYSRYQTVYLVMVVHIQVDAARSLLDVRFNNAFLLRAMLSTATTQHTHTCKLQQALANISRSAQVFVELDRELSKWH